MVHLRKNTQRLCSVVFLSLVPQSFYCWAASRGVSGTAFSENCTVLSRSPGCHCHYRELESLAIGFYATRLFQRQRRWGLGDNPRYQIILCHGFTSICVPERKCDQTRSSFGKAACGSPETESSFRKAASSSPEVVPAGRAEDWLH